MSERKAQLGQKTSVMSGYIGDVRRHRWSHEALMSLDNAKVKRHWWSQKDIGGSHGRLVKSRDRWSHKTLVVTRYRWSHKTLVKSWDRWSRGTSVKSDDKSEVKRHWWSQKILASLEEISEVKDIGDVRNYWWSMKLLVKSEDTICDVKRQC